MSEWFPLFFDVVDHERIAGADLTHLPRASREIMREAMGGLYVRALRDLQRARSNDGLVRKHALWGPMEARRTIAEELVRVGMLEAQGESYYPRNYLEKNRGGDAIRKAMGAAAERQRLVRSKKKGATVTRDMSVSHIDVTRDMSVTPVCDSLSVSSVLPDSDPDLPPPSRSPREVYVAESQSGVHVVTFETAPSTMPPADIPITPELEAACVMAGAPKPTRDHVQAMLAQARTSRKRTHDWPSAVVLWMIRQKAFDRDKPPPGKDTGPPEKRARTMSERPSMREQEAYFADFDAPTKARAK